MKTQEIVAIGGILAALALGAGGVAVVLKKEEAAAKERAQAHELERLRIEAAANAARPSNQAPRPGGGFSVDSILKAAPKVVQGVKTIGNIAKGLKGFLGL